MKDNNRSVCEYMCVCVRVDYLMMTGTSVCLEGGGTSVRVLQYTNSLFATI